MAAEAPEQPLLAWAVIASHFGPPFMVSGVAVGLPSLGAELGAGAATLGLVETTFLAGSMAALLPAGRLADAADKWSLFRLGLGAFCLLSVALALTSWLPALLVLRFLQGLASALFATTGPALLAELVPLQRRGTAFGAAMGAVYAGLTLGPLAAGWLVQLWSWRAVFVAGAAVIALAGAPTLRRQRPRPGPRAAPPDGRRPAWRAVHLPSAALLTSAALAAVFGSALLHNGAAGVALLSASAVLAAAFIAAQLGTARPLLDLRALRSNPPLCRALALQLALYLNAVASMFMLSLYLQESLGRSPDTAGWVLASGSAVMAVVAPFAGRCSDRWRPRPVLAAGAAAVLLSAAIATTLGQGSTLARAALVAVAHGLGFGLFSTPNMAIIMGSMPPQQSGMASALAAKSRSVGLVSGMLLTAGLISLDFGNQPIHSDPARFVGTMTTTFTVLTCTAAVALWLALAERDPRSRARGDHDEATRQRPSHSPE